MNLKCRAHFPRGNSPFSSKISGSESKIFLSVQCVVFISWKNSRDFQLREKVISGSPGAGCPSSWISVPPLCFASVVCKLPSLSTPICKMEIRTPPSSPIKTVRWGILPLLCKIGLRCTVAFHENSLRMLSVQYLTLGPCQHCMQ